MKTSPFDNGKLLLRRTMDERKPLIGRLNRIEGQVRGLKAMIEDDRYCGDELQQIKALIAGLRRVAMMIAQQHIAVAAQRLSDRTLREVANKDIFHVLGEALDIWMVASAVSPELT